MLNPSLFVSDLLHAKQIEIQGKTMTLHFRELPAVEFIKFHTALTGADQDARVGAVASLIAASLCEPNGAPAMDVAQALKLKTIPMKALFNAVMEINGGDGGKV